MAARLADLHAAFADPDVDGILTVIGGFNANQLLTGIDYSLVTTPRRCCAGSPTSPFCPTQCDARADLVSSGPHYSSFGIKHHFGYTEAGFRACVMEDGACHAGPVTGLE